ncbi:MULTISPECIES: hypothetical protein [unclassified Amycolatopsis]|uniref:DUF3885 domain-containing protein n=1 Tax=unclassified Amycolatopsis TaxID=2618356 RepID=UPI00106DDF02|nr:MULTISPECIES: hypothetical protein [unclassified Amycolatopsis]
MKLSALWREQWPQCRPLADGLKHAYPDRWVRFHSLPESQRYPGTDAEYEIVLGRYNTVLDELFGGQEVWIVTADWSGSPEPPELSGRHALWNPSAQHWATVRANESETDPEFIVYTHLYAGRRRWRTGLVDRLLRTVADDGTANVMIASLSFDRVHHPYDGGADILLPTTGERDELKRRHADWLSAHSSGF